MKKKAKIAFFLSYITLCCCIWLFIGIYIDIVSCLLHFNFYYHTVCRWPKTLAGITAYQPCLQYSFNSVAFHNGAEEAKAWRKCNRTGRWDEENYSECPYSQEITQVLHAFSQVTF